MKRALTAVAVLSISLICRCPGHMAWGQVLGVEARIETAPGSGGLAPLNPGRAQIGNPALQGGIPLLRGGVVPSATAPKITVKAAVAPTISPIPALSAPETPSEQPGGAKPEDALKSAQDFAGAITPGADGKEKSDSEVQQTSGKFFDQKIGSNGSENGGDGVGGNGNGGETANAGGSSINNPYPRVVFLQDVFTKPASDKTVAYIEKLADAGVHVVFLTWRPLKGPGSAEEVLLGRLKYHRNNPIMIAAFNGGKVSVHGRAANPKSIVEDELAFKPSDIETFRKINAKVAKSLKFPQGAAVAEEGLPSMEGAFTYSASIPNEVEDAAVPAMRAKMITVYNALLKAANLPYKMTAHPENPRAIITQAMPMRFSLPRIMGALNDLFPEEQPNKTPEKFLVIADSKKSPKFSTSFPKEAEIQVVTSGDGVEEALGAVLGDRSLPSVSVNLSKLRQYVEYWEPSHRYTRAEGEATGGGGSAVPYSSTDRETNGKFGMYTWSVISNYMAWFYEQIWRGQHQNTTLLAAQARLRDMWYKPMKYRVWVTKPLAKVMGTPAWKGMSRGYLEYANAYLTNFYQREFGEYTVGARNVQENLVSLSSDRKSLITLEFVSAATGKTYKIHTRIPRVMKLDTAEGRVLTAYVYRTGKEAPGEGEDLLARAMAMALLKGHAHKGPDGKWHHGSEDGPVIAKLKVQLEYRAGHRLWVFNPDEFLKLKDGQVARGHLVQELTGVIEREEADQEYQQYYEEHNDIATKQDMAKKKTKKAAASRSTKTAKTPSTTKKGRKS